MAGFWRFLPLPLCCRGYCCIHCWACLPYDDCEGFLGESENGAPCRFAIRPDGIIEGICGDCDGYNTEFITEVGEGGPTPFPTCTWIYQAGSGWWPDSCGVSQVRLEIQWWGDHWQVRVRVTGVAFQTILLFSRDYAWGELADCFAFDEAPIPLVYCNDALWTCVGSAATCKITAIVE